MSLRRLNPRRDVNELELVEALATLGFEVERLSGRGLPDLLVSRRHLWHAIEVKTTKGRDEPAQAQFRARHHAPVVRLVTVDDCISFSQAVP